MNSQAKSPILKEYLKKYGPHSNLAVATIDKNTPAEDQPQAGKDMWEGMAEEAKAKLG